MRFEVIFTAQFEKDIKFYKRKRKYLKIDDDVEEVVTELEKGNYVIKNDCEIYLLTIYSKKDQEDIPKEEIIRLITTYCV